MKTNVKLYVAFSCDKGDLRPSNDDRVLVKKYQVSGEGWGMLLVADGMGSNALGSEATRIIVDDLSRWWDNDLAQILSLSATGRLYLDSLDKTIKKANKKVANLQSDKIVGSTLSLVLIVGYEYVIRHVGDSRVYLLNSDYGIKQLTQDHTYVAAKVKEGLITEQEAKTHPKRNIITRCIGTKNMPSMFKYEGELASGEYLLLCSDGFYKCVSEDVILEKVFSNLSIDEKVAELRGSIAAGSACDNVSIILAHVERKE